MGDRKESFPSLFLPKPLSTLSMFHMAWRLADSVVHGEIDNRTQGLVVGKLWLVGCPEPVALQLKGNPSSDIVGCHLTFRRRNPTSIFPTGSELGEGSFASPELDSSPPDNLSEFGVPNGFNLVQEGVVGEITASRKVRLLPEIPGKTMLDILDMREAGENPGPDRLANVIYLEWYSSSNGRAVLELVDFEVTLSEPAWSLAPEQVGQADANLFIASQQLVDQLAEEFEATEFDMDADHLLSEFEWEAIFRESDSFAEKATELFEKYADHPDFEEILSRELGWEMVQGEEESEDEDDNQSLSGGGSTDAFQFETDSSFWDEEDEEGRASLPDPELEGVHWVYDEHGHVLHPLAKSIFDSCLELRKWCATQGYLGEEGDPDVKEMLFQFQCAGTRCAGALQSLAYKESETQPGFIVARLKRALDHIHKSIAAGSCVIRKKLLPMERMAPFHRLTFSYREQIIDWMQRARRGEWG